MTLIETSLSVNHWENFLQQLPHSNFYYTPAWLAILEESYGFTDASRIYTSGDDEILVPMVRKELLGWRTYHSLPIGYGGFLSPRPLPMEYFPALFKSIIHGRDISFQCYISPYNSQYYRNLPCFQEIKTNLNYVHVLSLEGGFEELWKKRFKKGVKFCIHRAKKNHFSTFVTSQRQDYEMLYRFYQESATGKQYVNPFPWELLDAIRRKGGNHANLRMVEKGGHSVGGLLSFQYGTDVSLFLLASDPSLKGYCLNHLLFHDTLNEACKEGYGYCDFGESGEYTGMRTFKENFGAEYQEVKRFQGQSLLGKLYSMAARGKSFLQSPKKNSPGS